MLSHQLKMICSCGGEMKEHKVTKRKVVVWAYERCKPCGRIFAWSDKPKILEEDDA